MPKYQIEATIETIIYENKITIVLQGISKYNFERVCSNGKKIKWNIFESINESDEPIFKLQNKEYVIQKTETNDTLLNLLCFAFNERKVSKFVFNENFAIIGITHATS